MPTIATQPNENGTVPDGDCKVSISSILDNPQIPSPPAVVLQIVDKVSKPDCKPAEVLTLLSQDSGLCCQVLKTVNSGLYGLSKPVGSLKQAVMMLGVRPLRSLVLSLALPAIGKSSSKDDVILKYWQESVAGAVIARELAHFLKRPDPEDDLVAGLLRDLGILVLREAFPQEYRDLWTSQAQHWAHRQCEEERETFGVDHAEISAGLLNSWNLPPEMYLPIRHHHDPESFTDAAPPLLARTWLLCFASKVAMLDSNSARPVSELLHIAQSQFAMDQAALVKFLASVMPAIREFAGILKVDVSRMPNYSEVIATGCQELIRLSVETSQQSIKKSDPNKVANGTTSEGSPMTSTRTQKPKERVGGSSGGVKKDGSGLPEFDLSFLDEVQEGGFQLNGLEVKEILGRGGMGVVFKAYDPLLDRFAAVKMMTPEYVVVSDARERFKREARAAAAIQHENVITIYAVNEVHSLPYLVMEYLTGTSLQERLDKEGPLPVADIVKYGRQIAGGLSAAHQRRVIHRDIKPANVLLAGESKTVKITDFGLARVLDETRISQDGLMVGTPLFMAPEQFSGLGVDHRSDLFSLGALLYNLCAGKTPFNGTTVMVVMKQVCTATPLPLRHVRPELPAWLVSTINKLLVKVPAARYQTAAEVLQIFETEAASK